MLERRYLDYDAARAEAIRRATEYGRDVAIRAVKEYGQLGYNLSFACVMDSDYSMEGGPACVRHATTTRV